MGSTNTVRQGLVLTVHLCDLRPGIDTWSATIAIEGPVFAQGITVAIFYEGRKVSMGELDEWGYWLAELEDLPPPFDLTAQTHFEVRTKVPPSSFLSPKFHPPIVASSLKSFLEKSRAWPKDLPLRGALLQGVVLSQSDLKGVDLTGANLTGAKFWGANLTGAILREALLDQADFSSATLVRADLQGASAKDTKWDEANLKGSDLRAVQGLSLEVLGNWIDLATLDEAQIARVKLSNLSKKQEDTYNGPKYGMESKNYPVSDSISRSSGNSFYKSFNESKRLNGQEEDEVEEEPWAPRLPPALILSDEEVESSYQAERTLYQSKLEKYRQERELRGGIQFSLNMIPNGVFEMGSDVDEDNERPRHKVKMSFPLLVSDTLVTQELYNRVMGQSQFKFSGAQHPAESVSWSEAIDFCNRLSQLEGLKSAYEFNRKGMQWVRESNGYRLPTEAEWEYFARASINSIYAGSNDIDLVGWYQDNSKETTQPVCQKRENAWGLFDISGNVWEWCYDTYSESSYHKRGEEPTEDPVEEGEGPKVIRGGSWSYEPHGLRLAYRSRLSAKFKTSRVGFRVVRSPKLKMKGE